MTTDLTWITDANESVGVVRVDPTDFIVFTLDTLTPPVRLTWVPGNPDPTSEIPTTLLINGIAEDREDIMGLMGLIESAERQDLPPGEVAFIGNFPDHL